MPGSSQIPTNGIIQASAPIGKGRDGTDDQRHQLDREQHSCDDSSRSEPLLRLVDAAALCSGQSDFVSHFGWQSGGYLVVLVTGNRDVAADRDSAALVVVAHREVDRCLEIRSWRMR